MNDRGPDDQGDEARPLRLVAMDGEDLAVVSTHLQDALVRIADVAFLPEARRFALLVDRFDWCAAGCGRMERRRTGLHFDGVVRAMRLGLEQNDATVLNLLSISFVETDAPAGVVTLTFSGGAAIRLEVECLDAQMRDMGQRWSVTRKPGHDVQSAEAESMPMTLEASAPDFEPRFAEFLGAKRESSADVDQAVKDILADVRLRGDAALIDYSLRFDGVDLGKLGLRVSQGDIEGASAQCSPEALKALRFAYERIVSFHKRQRPEDVRFTDSLGVELGWRWTAIDSVGLYVPGGAAAYPSSVLMNAAPAKVAGVGRLAMVVPAPNGRIEPLVLAAARLAGVDEVYRVGGAQAIGALAYGTRTISPVAKIVGPGNAYVAAAKRQVFGTVGIDMIAGPSEIVVLADAQANPDWIAADLLAQAEHDRAAQSILVTNAPALARAVEASVERQLAVLPRREIAAASWKDFGAILLVGDLGEALALVDRIAPEHLEIMTADPESLAARVRHAGAIFIGPHTPEAIGDYVGGSNHVLPTARSARFSSGLGVVDFLKRTSILKCGAEALRALAPAAVALGEAEGLGAHARSVSIRLNPGAK